MLELEARESSHDHELEELRAKLQCSSTAVTRLQEELLKAKENNQELKLEQQRWHSTIGTSTLHSSRLAL